MRFMRLTTVLFVQPLSQTQTIELCIRLSDIPHNFCRVSYYSYCRRKCDSNPESVPKRRERIDRTIRLISFQL